MAPAADSSHLAPPLRAVSSSPQDRKYVCESLSVVSDGDIRITLGPALSQKHVKPQTVTPASLRSASSGLILSQCSALLMLLRECHKMNRVLGQRCHLLGSPGESPGSWLWSSPVPAL